MNFTRLLNLVAYGQVPVKPRDISPFRWNAMVKCVRTYMKENKIESA